MMTINVSEALDSDTAEIITVTRFAVGSYVDGVWIDGATSTFKTVASVQQPSPKQLQRLAENQRLLDLRLFISKAPLYTSDDRTGQQADIVHYKGKQYTVISSGDWDVYGHTDAVGALLP
jgi:hypothetical protein